MSGTPRPSSGSHLLTVELGAVLFSAPSQNLYALNGAAALVWCGLEDGLDDEAILDGLIAAGAPAGEARSWYRQSIEMFALRGLLEGTQPPAPPRIETRSFGEAGDRVGEELPVRERIFLRVFDSLVELRLADPALGTVLHEIFGHLVVPPHRVGDEPADIALGIASIGGGWIVTRDGVVAVRATTLGELAGEIDKGVSALALERTAYLLEFRAAFLMRGDRGFLFAGPTGSGKSTLAAALMGRGWRYGSDERVLLNPVDYKLRTAAKNLRINRGSWPVLAPLFAELEASPIYGSSGRPVRYLAARGAVVTEARLDHVVFCRYRSDGATALRPMPRHEALQELFANCASVPHPLALCDVEALVDWSSTIAFHRLDVADLGKAVDLLQQEL